MSAARMRDRMLGHSSPSLVDRDAVGDCKVDDAQRRARYSVRRKLVENLCGEKF